MEKKEYAWWLMHYANMFRTLAHQGEAVVITADSAISDVCTRLTELGEYPSVQECRRAFGRRER
jgi:hypothetical protein